jgi:hypothetical protein
MLLTVNPIVEIALFWSVISIHHGLVRANVITTVPERVPLERRTTYEIITSSTSASTINFTAQLWVAQGSVDCGPSLFPDPCVPVEYSATTTWTDSESNVVVESYSSSYFTTLVPVNSNRFSPIVVSSLFTTTSGFNSSAATPTSIPLVKRDAAIAPSETGLPLFAHLDTLDTLQLFDSPPLARRGFALGYNSCIAVANGQDYTTNSLPAVCNFVADAQIAFVSLAPTTAAYLPTWLDYLISLLLIVVSLVFIRTPPGVNTRSYSPEHDNDEFPVGHRTGIAGHSVAIVSLIYAIVRLSLAIYQLAKHGPTFDTLPFISPLLWIDWLAIAQMWGGKLKSLNLKPLTVPILALLWLISLWLCIGYAFLGYGTQQYDVLEIASSCILDANYAPISWQTDPRRIVFMYFHIVLFGLATWTFYENWASFQRTRIVRRDRIVFWKRFEVHKIMSLILGIVLLLFLAAGTVMIGILNEKEYILLNRNNCFGSYVSSRTTFITVQALDWPTRISVWFGMNV